ncbi:MAG: tetratricopeptide repeat protein [Cellvibrionaceae bacterium]|nr:tetratricopeptide repeat protein [Cellvibrionaceae bacterium]
MRSINRQLILSVCLGVLLSACGSVPQKNTREGRVQTIAVPAPAQQRYRQVLGVIDDQQWDKAEVLLQEMLVDYPQLLGLRASLGWVYWQADNTEAAIDTLTPLLDNNSLYKPDAYNILAIIYRQQGDFKQATELYRHAIGIWPDDAQLHKNLGIIYELYLGQLSHALNHYRQAQLLQTKKNKQLDGWVKDLERRLR